MSDEQVEARRSVYVETTILSYLTARPTRDAATQLFQQITREWWEACSQRYRLVVSPTVMREIARGDPQAAARRIEIASRLELLAPLAQIEQLADELFAALQLPTRALEDAAHLAYAVYYNIDYLLSWNCSHLANAETNRHLARMAAARGFWQPVVVSPIQFVPNDSDDDSSN